MPRLPSRDDLGARPSMRPSGPVDVTVGVSAGRGLAQLGAGVAQLGASFEKEDRFAAERAFTEFAYEREREYSDSVKNAQPGASGFRDTIIGGYQKSAKGFLKNIPEHLKAEYDGKLLDFETRLSRTSDNFETKERERFAVEGVKDSHNRLALLVQADPSKYEESAKSSKVLLDNVPVDPITRETLRKQYDNVIAKSGVEGILQAGGTAEDVRAFINRIQPKSGPVAANTMQGRIAANVSNAPLALAIAERESSFRHDAKASKTIRGLFQMDAATRAKYGLADDASPEEQAKVFDQEISARGAELEKQIGRKPNEQELYFAWHFGAQGAAELLKSDPYRTTKDWVFETFGKNARAVWDQNKHIRDAGSVGELINQTGGDIQKRIDKYGGADAINRGELSELEAFGQTRIVHYKNKLSVQKAEGLERQIIDAAAGLGALPSREAISGEEGIEPQHKNALLRQFDAAEKEVRALNDARARFESGGPFNPFDPVDKKLVEKIYQSTGHGEQPLSPMERLQAVVDRTGIVPQSAVVGMRGAIASGEPARVASSLTVASNILQRNPNVFDPVEGGKAIEEATVKFRHYTEDLGFTAQESANRIVEQQKPEYKAKVQAKIKNEDLNEIVKKKLSVSDIGNHFQPWFSREPNVGFGPEQRGAMYNDYAELFREYYLDNGDVGESKRLAKMQLEKVWGVTKVGGSSVVMRYPPERSAAFHGIEDAGKFISEEAVSAIKKETGKEIEANTISILPIPGVTSRQFHSGESPQYFLFWRDKNGVPQQLNPGRALTLDPAEARRSQTERRAKEFEDARKREERFQQNAPHVYLRDGVKSLFGTQ